MMMRRSPRTRPGKRLTEVVVVAVTEGAVEGVVEEAAVEEVVVAAVAEDSRCKVQDMTMFDKAHDKETERLKRGRRRALRHTEAFGSGIAYTATHKRSAQASLRTVITCDIRGKHGVRQFWANV